MMAIVWSNAALDDLRAIHAHIAKGAQSTADHFVVGLVSAADVLSNFPMMGRLVPEARLPNIREIAHRGYRMIYRLEEDGVTLLAVIHGSRDLARLGPMPWEIIE